MLVDRTQPCVMSQVEYDTTGQLRARYILDQGRRNGPAQTYDGAGNLLSQASYKAGNLHGQATRYAPPAEPLAWIDGVYQHDLDAGGVSPDLCQALAAEKIPLAGDEQIIVEEPGREWSLTQGALIYTLRAVGEKLAISIDRVIERAQFQDGWLVERTRYAAGALHGERTCYAIPDPPLSTRPPGDEGSLDVSDILTLPLGYLVALEASDIAILSRVLARVGIELGADARVSETLAGAEWLIEPANGRAYSIWSAAQRLIIAPSRLVQRELFANGAIMSIESFVGGLLEGVMTQFGEVGENLHLLELAAQVALATRDLAALNKQYQLSLPTYAQVFTEIPGFEWFIYAPEQSYSVRRVGPQLALSIGRVVQRAAYHAGKRMGETWLFADGRLQQSNSFQTGELQCVTTYRDGKKQSDTTYRAGLQDGPSLTYDEQGRIISSANYTAGQLDGELVLYQDGRIVASMQYQSNKRHGTSITYYPHGRPQLVSEYVNDVQQGLSTYYDPDGNRLEKLNYRDNQLDGVALKYYAIGQIQELVFYSAGQRIGPYLQISEAGRLSKLCGYVRGNIIGIAVAYYSNGNKKEEIYYDKNGHKIGVIIYNPDGNIISSSVPKDPDLPSGLIKDQGENQELSTLTYKDGRLDQDFQVCNRAGSVILKGRCTDSPTKAVITIFDPPGIFSQKLELTP
ncbi:MAG: hypothetical protein HGA19_05265 [Oscillochloris sp.]|nr:hypothetical protein [Oscillochloris sp.]